MFKVILTTISMMMLALTSTCAFAIRISETFDVSVTIPTAAFHVIPSDPDWIHLEQRLNWNPVTSELSSLRKQFDVKNENGAISARLHFEPYLSNGRETDDIPLIVKFNNKRLTLDPDEVVSEVEGRAGKRVGLEIAAVKPGDGYKAGDYYGNVHMIFEAIAP
ncbi:CS1 type fimbrial major subunit [Pseudomonas izuensis]|uniref:CS1 type fimbrial major subunit n=1 Tax=Pseudomonas izuensis TaxID=2684212 RepID=UPI00135A1E04|nr:CS1 type fimbrial major subunit [Pseudomonas izuensis]